MNSPSVLEGHSLNGHASATKIPTVAIIGLGAISSGYSSPDEEAPYSHAGGLAHSKLVRLVAVADMSEVAREAFVTKWGPSLPGVQVFDSSTALFEYAASEEPVDIVAVCVRGPFHFVVVREVLAAAAKTGTRAIFLEKPPTCSLEEMDELVALASEAGVAITVSYSRHWAPHVLRLEELVREGLIGDVHSVVGYCGQLILSFASHTTDLIRQFSLAQKPGHAISVQARAYLNDSDKRTAPKEGFEHEPNLLHMNIEWSNGVLGTQIGTDGDGGAFYVDVFGTKGRVRAGIYLPPQAWDENNEPIELTDMPANASVFQIAYDQIANYLNGGPLADCTDAAWQEVNEIGFAAIESATAVDFEGTGPRIELPNTKRDRKIWANG